MDLESLTSSRNFVKCCDCGCGCSSVAGTSENWLRSVKRKYDEYGEAGRFSRPGPESESSVARVGFENECAALREMVGSQQQTIQDLYSELEEERNAASTAANETMTMILRLQGEKAEVQMESRQFKRFAEEKMLHDQQELLALEDLLYKREQAIQSLTCEVQAYRHRMLSFGLTEDEVDLSDKRKNKGNVMLEFESTGDEILMFEYPPLRCSLNDPRVSSEADYDGRDDDDDDDGRYRDYDGEGYDEVADVEKYVFGETPRNRDHLKDLERRIHLMERSPSNNQLEGDFLGSRNVLDKVIVGQSPRRSRKLSDDSPSFAEIIRENGVDLKTKYVYQPDEYVARKADNVSEVGDDTSDRVYTIDSVHNGAIYNNGYAETRGPSDQGAAVDPDIKKLYARLQALEADRESMRQAIVSMGTDKAQLVLLKEIAQQLCKDKSTEREVTVKKPSVFRSWPFLSVFKWVMSFVFWRRKARRSKYSFGILPNNAGLLMLLDKGPRTTPWRCITSTQVYN